MYESEFTQFLRTLKQQRPQLEVEQKQGRALLWDKAPRSLDEIKQLQEARVAQAAYVYQNQW